MLLLRKQPKTYPKPKAGVNHSFTRIGQGASKFHPKTATIVLALRIRHHKHEVLTKMGKSTRGKKPTILAFVFVMLGSLMPMACSDYTATCETDMDCPDTQMCMLAHCVDINCPNRRCPIGWGCVDGFCVDPRCFEIDCPEGQGCAGGDCIDGDCQTHSCPGLGEICIEEACLADSCMHVDCPENEACAMGRCYPKDCDTKLCTGYGEVCVDETCEQRTCVGVDCPAGDQCANGYCYPMDCGALECPAGQVCEQNVCIDRACVEVECASSQTCANGLCWETNCPSQDCAEGEVCEGDICIDPACVQGRCEDPCEGVTCDTPPDPTCSDASTLTTYSGPGECVLGHCQYPSDNTTCPAGCAEGACNNEDPCEGIICDDPPANTCTDATHLRAYDPIGTCSDGQCEYTFSNVECPDGCVEGSCIDNPCEGIICDDPPANTCTDANHLRAYDPMGTCSDGQCEYTFSSVECPEGCVNDECQGCEPSTCTDLGFECGLHDDGCGQNINCGSCDNGFGCESGQCVCQPSTCGDLGFECGLHDNGCGQNINCGSCGTGFDCESGQCVATCEHECEGWVCNPCCHDDMVTRCEEQADGCNDIIVMDDCTTKQAEGQYVYTCRSSSCQCRYCCGVGTLCPGTAVSTTDCPGGNCCTQACQVDDCYARDNRTVNYSNYETGCNSSIDLLGHPSYADLYDVLCDGSWWINMSNYTSDCSTGFILTTPALQDIHASPNPYNSSDGTNLCISISGADVCTFCGIPVGCVDCTHLTGGCEASGSCDLVATNTAYGNERTWTYWSYCSLSSPCACSFEDTDCRDTDTVTIHHPNYQEGCNSYINLRGHPTGPDLDNVLCRGIWWVDMDTYTSDCSTNFEL